MFISRQKNCVFKNYFCYRVVGCFWYIIDTFIKEQLSNYKTRRHNYFLSYFIIKEIIIISIIIELKDIFSFQKNWKLTFKTSPFFPFKVRVGLYWPLFITSLKLTSVRPSNLATTLITISNLATGINNYYCCLLVKADNWGM